MSINIDKKKLRKELFDELEGSKSLPLWYTIGTGCTITYDGEYLKVHNLAGQYSAIGTGFGSPAYQATRDTYSLLVAAKIKAPGGDTSIYFFFLEPRKGNYDNFQGFRHDGANHCFEFRDTGAEEQDNIAGQDWTTEHTFMIKHKKDGTLCQGYIDGALKAESTDALKISDQPFCVYVAEPNGVARDVYLKYPPGIYMESG